MKNAKEYGEFLSSASLEELRELTKKITFRMILDGQGRPKSKNALHLLMSRGKIEDGEDVLELIDSFAKFLTETKKRDRDEANEEQSDGRARSRRRAGD